MKKSGLVFSELKDLSVVDEVVYLARQAHEESRFSYITFAPNKVRAIAERAICNPKRYAAMMAWDSGKPVGFVYGSIGEYHIGTGALVTTIHNINVLKEVRYGLRGGRVALGLFQGIETWSKARSSKEILFHVTSDVDLSRTHKFIKRLGYRFIGGSYAKNII
ncbi:hypothetical protein [uncultured Tateyamaria sp.]|uniref:hypothetical protein n=1 Tax=uncultured Tateyamaria sp. TaxID=455651 RepID=UPI00260E8ABD|nr:hypothetical protein [uncultured Tateyamaria sp.]